MQRSGPGGLKAPLFYPRGRMAGFIFLAGLILWAYFPLLSRFFKVWRLGDNSYCYLVPLIFAYLCWEKRSEFRFREMGFHPLGLPALIFSFLLAYAGLFSAVDFLLYLGFWAAILSLALLLYGKRVRALRFPFLILLFMAPLPPFVRRILTFKLQLLTSRLSALLLNAVGLEVLREGNLLHVGGACLQIAEACSGLRYFMPLILLALLVSYYGLRSLWARLIMVFLVAPVAVLSNALRVFLTGVLVARGHSAVLEEPYHSLLGWLVFVLALGLFLLSLLILRFLENRLSPSAEASPSPGEDRVSAGRVSLWPAVIFGALLLAGGWGFRMVPELSTRLTSRPLLYFPLEIGGWHGEPRRLSPRILKSLWADDYFYGLYRRKDFPGVIFLLIPYYSYQTTWHTIHTPQSCLLGGGWDIVRTGIWELDLSGKRAIQVKYLWLRKGGQRLLATYFFMERGRVLVNPWKHKFYLLRDAVLRRRTDGALVRVEMLCPPGLNRREAERALREFLRALWPHLQRFIPG